jgi:hypothetical protein
MCQNLYNTDDLVVQVNNDVSASCHWEDFDAFAHRTFICDNIFIDTELEERRIWPNSLPLLDIIHTIYPSVKPA